MSEVIGSGRSSKIRSSDFYGEYYGHRIEHLDALLPQLRASSDALIWLAGDSTLDNKYWLSGTAPAVPGAYQNTLEPPYSKPDVTYWLNHLAAESSEEELRRDDKQPSPKWAAINTAVEATTLNERTFRLRPQDRFLRDNIQAKDVLVVSVGGNDIALAPSPCTIASMLGLMFCLPKPCIEQGCSCAACPLDDCCCGCGPSLWSCLCSCPPCLGYFRHMFGTRTQKYIEALTVTVKPQTILVCMVYYPDETASQGWAGPALNALGYNSNPAKLQSLILKAFREVSSTIRISGSQVIPVPLFHVLNGKNSEDYVERVEPSVSGGKKMAEFFLDHLRREPSSSSLRVVEPTSFAEINNKGAPSSALMRDRS